MTDSNVEITRSGRGKSRLNVRLWLLWCALLAVGVYFCSLDYGRQFWGNWLHSGSFNLGLLAISFAIGSFIANTRSLVSGLVVGIALVVFAGLLLWTYPGWLLLHSLIHGPMR